MRARSPRPRGRLWGLRCLRDFDDVVGRVTPLEMGPPVGWPIEYRISGDDPLKVRTIAGGRRDVGIALARCALSSPAAP